MKPFAIFLTVILSLALVCLFWILHYEGVRHQAKVDRVEQEKLIEEIAKLKKDVHDARAERNQWIFEANRLKQKGAR